MRLLEEFSLATGQEVRVSAQQASRFAKEIAGDFNPIHDVGSKRFCVPGDLLFSLVLARYGLSQRMAFAFTGMVGDGVGLRFPETDAGSFEITDTAGKPCLRVERSGETSRDPALIEALARQYCAFSGHNFPHILVPLMTQHRIMINPERPLVIYEGMSFDLHHLDLRGLEIELADSRLEVNGKRGDARLDFRIRAGGEPAGSGCKKLVLSGLREYDAVTVQDMVRQYTDWKVAYQA